MPAGVHFNRIFFATARMRYTNSLVMRTSGSTQTFNILHCRSSKPSSRFFFHPLASCQTTRCQPISWLATSMYSSSSYATPGFHSPDKFCAGLLALTPRPRYGRNIALTRDLQKRRLASKTCGFGRLAFPRLGLLPLQHAIVLRHHSFSPLCIRRSTLASRTTINSSAAPASSLCCANHRKSKTHSRFRPQQQFSYAITTFRQSLRSLLTLLRLSSFSTRPTPPTTMMHPLRRTSMTLDKESLSTYPSHTVRGRTIP